MFQHSFGCPGNLPGNTHPSLDLSLPIERREAPLAGVSLAQVKSQEKMLLWVGCPCRYL